MSPPNKGPCETTLLLGDIRPAGQSSTSITEKRFGFSSGTLLVPVALATKLAAGLPSTTFIELVRQTVCKLWNASHRDPATIASGGSNTSDICDAPEVMQYFATVLAIFAVAQGMILIGQCGALSCISSRYGRRPAFLFVLLAALVGSCMIPGSQFMPDWLAYWALLVGILATMFSDSVYLINLYIVDGCAPEDRTAVLSKISGWAGLGSCISFALGGFITTKSGDPLIVFYVAAAIYAATLIYVASVLPESFPEEKRKALACMHAEHSTNGLPAPTRSLPLAIFKPLKMLAPTYKSDGTRNWRLTWCAAHEFVLVAAQAYVPAAWLVLATSKYHLTPEDTGIFLTASAISGTIILVLIVPRFLRVLRPYYRRKVVRFEEEDTIDSKELESETSDQLHVHLAVASCVVAAIVYLALAATNRALIFFGICAGFTYVHRPTMHSLVAGSVDPLKQGEALAAIEMITNAGRILSPIIMGSILTATIGSTPLLLFYVHVVVALISSALLLLVRDTDRYRKPHEM